MNKDFPPASPSLATDGRRGASLCTSYVRLALVAVLAAGIAHPAAAQTGGGRSEVFAGSEFESYLRYLQTLGKSKPTVWTIRSLEPSQNEAISPTDSVQ